MLHVSGKNFLPRYRITYAEQLIINHLYTLERELMSLRDDLTANEAAVTQAITDLAARITQLPGTADDITQADVDDLKNFASSLAQLAPSTSATTPTPGDDNPPAPGDGEDTPAS